MKLRFRRRRPAAPERFDIRGEWHEEPGSRGFTLVEGEPGRPVADDDPRFGLVGAAVATLQKAAGSDEVLASDACRAGESLTVVAGRRGTVEIRDRKNKRTVGFLPPGAARLIGPSLRKGRIPEAVVLREELNDDGTRRAITVMVAPRIGARFVEPR